MPLEYFPLTFTKKIFFKKMEYLCYMSLSVAGTKRGGERWRSPSNQFPLSECENPVPLGYGHEAAGSVTMAVSESLC